MGEILLCKCVQHDGAGGSFYSPCGSTSLPTGSMTVGCILMHGRDWSPAGGVPNEERNGAKAEGRKAPKKWPPCHFLGRVF